MTNELGRELTTAEAIAVATGQMTIMDVLHGVALELDAERDAEIYTVMPSGTVITRGELWNEMHRPVRSTVPASRTGHDWVIGVNASASMFA